MMETLKSLAKLRHGKFGKIRAGFDWYPDCPESEVRKERSIEIVMHPDTARDLAGLSRILRLGNLPDMDIDLQVGAVSGETLCNMTLSLLDREIAYGESENGGPAEYEWDGMDDVHYAVKVNSSEVRIEIRNEDDFRSACPSSIRTGLPASFRKPRTPGWTRGRKGHARVEEGPDCAAPGWRLPGESREIGRCAIIRLDVRSTNPARSRQPLENHSSFMAAMIQESRLFLIWPRSAFTRTKRLIRK